MFEPSTVSRSRAWVEVQLDRLRANALAVQRSVGTAVGILPMVKADAYGLGMPAVVRSLLPMEPWGFGVATVDEGIGLRSADWSGRALVFSPTLPADLERAAAADLTLCFSSVQMIERWATLASDLQRKLRFHVEIDTGMGRAGFPAERACEWGEAVQRAAQGRLEWEGCFTHFHSADEPDPSSVDVQWQRFQEAVASLPRVPAGEPRRVLHVANSAASMRRADLAVDLARPGIFLYGGGVGAEEAPLPIAALRARVVHLRDAVAGTSTGYGATYKAHKGQRWGTLAIGYGDGVPRALANSGGKVLVRGRRVPIIGRISMDMTVVDLTELPEVGTGEVATIIGSDGPEEILLDEVARRCGTISYEILTGLTSRLPRVYLNR